MHVISERPISSKKTNVPTFVVVVILKGNLHYISSGLVFFNKFEILNTSRLMGRKSNRGDICICMADSLCYTAETNTRRQWQPIPVLLPGNSPGWKSLVGCSPLGSLRVRHNWATSLSLFTFMQWRRKWQPTPVFLPGESQGRGRLVGCRLRGHTESDTTEAT